MYACMLECIYAWLCAFYQYILNTHYMLGHVLSVEAIHLLSTEEIKTNKVYSFGT